AELKPSAEPDRRAVTKEPSRAQEKEAGQPKPTARKEAPTGDGRRTQPIQPPTPPAPGKKVVPAGPATRRLARELGVDLSQVRGTGPGGRVTPEDVKTHVRELSSGTAWQAGGIPHAPPLPDFSHW